MGRCFLTNLEVPGWNEPLAQALIGGHWQEGNVGLKYMQVIFLKTSKNLFYLGL